MFNPLVDFPLPVVNLLNTYQPFPGDHQEGRGGAHHDREQGPPEHSPPLPHSENSCPCCYSSSCAELPATPEFGVFKRNELNLL